jgi:hypothetical protein
MKKQSQSDQSAPHGAERIGHAIELRLTRQPWFDILPGQISISALNAKKADLVPTSYEYMTDNTAS